jgi:O-antigen ligase
MPPRRAASLAGASAKLSAGAILLLPVALLYARSVSEILIAVIGVVFLAECAARRDWTWLRARWVWVAAGFWAWTVLCSTPVPAWGLGAGGLKSLVQAVALGRFLILAAALECRLRGEPGLRRALFAVLAAVALWIVLECWQQYLFGRNIHGYGRWMDGALTGPFRAPRAGPELVLILFPAVLPGSLALLRRGRVASRILGGLWFGVAVLTMVLIGQRMPALLTALGLVLCGLILPGLRRLVLVAAVAGAALLAATPVVSPPTFQKLVVHFSQQMRHFPTSDYGQLYIRATVMGLDHPWTGLGFDGFRDHCEEARYRRGLPALGIPDGAAQGAGACNIHPHNHYLEAFTEGGVPGLVLFGATVLAWLLALGRGLGRGSAARAGCFIATVLAFWPLASTSALFTLPNAGWTFLVLGAGLAELTGLN